MDERLDNLYPDAEPIFIVGAFSSGTTIMCDAIRNGARLPGFGEGWLFPTAYTIISYLPIVWRELGYFKNTKNKAISEFDVCDLQLHVLRYFHEQSNKWNVKRWVDKTPGLAMLHASSMLTRAYPKARFIFMKRNGLRVVRSRMRMNAGVAFRRHCEDWAHLMRDWSGGKHLFEGRYLEIDQREVALEADRVAAAVGAFLGLDQEQTEGIAAYCLNNRPRNSSSTPDDEELKVDAVGWTEEQVQVFTEVCGSAMNEHGYSF